jgi:AcrR family transcriptional regulator
MSEPDAPAKDRILSAALEEFATRGYEAASTNAIAAKAGVAKGLVFHHFGSKEALLLALFEREVARMTTLVFEAPGPRPPDLFKRLYQLTLRKLEISQQHPLTAEFLIIALSEAPPGVKAKLMARNAELLKAAWPRLIDGLDASKLRAGLTLADAIETLGLLSDGLEKQLTAMLRAKQLPLTEVARRAWVHFERLRDGLYR